MRQTSSIKLTTTREEFDVMAADVFLCKVNIHLNIINASYLKLKNNLVVIVHTPSSIWPIIGICYPCSSTRSIRCPFH